VDEVVVKLLERALGAPLDPPKRAEFHLAKRLLRKAEELLARDDYIRPPKVLGRRPDSQSRQERKRAEKPRRPLASRQRDSRRRQRAEEAWSRADVLHQDFYGLDATRRCMP
jgi:hypothetical protein